MSDEDIHRFESSLEDVEHSPDRHVSIEWGELPANSPVKKFAVDYNFYHDESEAGHEWCEHVLTDICNARTLDDLKGFNAGDWYICAKLLKSGFTISSKLLGDILEKVMKEAEKANVEIPVLAIRKAKRGRPGNERSRFKYLSWLMFKVRELTTEKGMSHAAAFENIAEENHKSPETIRRDYERFMKNLKHRNLDHGEK